MNEFDVFLKNKAERDAARDAIAELLDDVKTGLEARGWSAAGSEQAAIVMANVVLLRGT